ncbi:MAG: 6-phosphogluconolactonase [Gammaproteobacteria bacterium]|jgi:6-phosphogluconolactonase (cycloisomerase 2 family)|nr:6-phosphogluconolactonase [Gammaproteobacteria bacterium]
MALAVRPSADASAEPRAAAAESYAYVGTYTPNGGGIYLFRVDRASGALTQIQVVDDIRNPSWLALNPGQTRLYAISEIDNFEGKKNGAVVSYAVDADNLRLTRLGAVSSAGAAPTYVSVHPSGRFVFAANFGGGTVAVFPVAANGALSDASDVRPSVGARHRARAVDDPPGQFANSDHDAPHPHMVASDPSGQFVIANDAGLDLTLVWRFDAQAGRLLPAEAPVIAAPSGSAPRHFVFHPNGRVFYNLYEHDAKVVVYDYDGATGRMRHKQTISAAPQKFAGSILSSAIRMTMDGHFLYVANRLHSGLSAFAVAADGQLHMIADTWVHADSPRSIAIDPGGDLLFSCNQKGDSITSFRINASNGTLQFTGRYEPLGSPAFITLLQR